MYTQWWRPYFLQCLESTALEYDHRTRHWSININYTAKPTSGATRVAENKERRKRWGKWVHCKINIWFLSISKNSVCWQKKLCSSSIDIMIVLFFSNFIYLFHNDYKTSYVPYTNHSRWLWDPRSCDLRVAGNRSTRNKPTCRTWWPHDHHTCRRVFVNVNVCICHLL